MEYGNDDGNAVMLVNDDGDEAKVILEVCIVVGWRRLEHNRESNVEGGASLYSAIVISQPHAP
jgi:hypothetical protein